MTMSSGEPPATPPSSPLMVRTDAVDPHPERARRILRDHSEVRGLFGRNPLTALCVLGVAALQLGIAFAVGGRPWWTIVLTAWVAGAFVNHALWALIHECVHNLVFPRPWANRVLAIVANLPIGLPAAISFGMYHLTHHKHLGVPEYDADLPAGYERWLLNRGFLGRMTWQILYPLAQPARTLWVEPVGAPPSMRRWILPNILAVFASDAAVFHLAGADAIVYLIASSVFGIGPHPLGARWIQEHYTVGPLQETSSYYGVLNRFQFNIGMHTEHHDLPQVPWNRLPAVRAAAPELYQPLISHRSWTLLWLRFLFDRRHPLSRVVRQPRVRAAPSEEGAVQEHPSEASMP